MELKLLKQALKDSDKDTVREVLDRHGEDVLEAATILDISADDIEDTYQGEYKSDVHFAQEMADAIGALDKEALWPRTWIDWDYAAKELMYDYCEENGHYFRNL